MPSKVGAKKELQKKSYVLKCKFGLIEQYQNRQMNHHKWIVCTCNTLCVCVCAWKGGEGVAVSQINLYT